QGKEAHEHARLDRRRGRQADASPCHEPRAVPGVDPRGGAPRGHAEVASPAQARHDRPPPLLDPPAPPQSCSTTIPPTVTATPRSGRPVRRSPRKATASGTANK